LPRENADLFVIARSEATKHRDVQMAREGRMPEETKQSRKRLIIHREDDCFAALALTDSE
jgi:hypothetical protein